MRRAQVWGWICIFRKNVYSWKGGLGNLHFQQLGEENFWLGIRIYRFCLGGSMIWKSVMSSWVIWNSLPIKTDICFNRLIWAITKYPNNVNLGSPKRAIWATENIVYQNRLVDKWTFSIERGVHKESKLALFIIEFENNKDSKVKRRKKTE